MMDPKSWAYNSSPSMLWTESCEVVGGREDTSSICPDHNMILATDQRWDELCFDT